MSFPSAEAVSYKRESRHLADRAIGRSGHLLSLERLLRTSGSPLPAAGISLAANPENGTPSVCIAYGRTVVREGLRPAGLSYDKDKGETVRLELPVDPDARKLAAFPPEQGDGSVLSAEAGLILSALHSLDKNRTVPAFNFSPAAAGGNASSAVSEVHDLPEQDGSNPSLYFIVLGDEAIVTALDVLETEMAGDAPAPAPFVDMLDTVAGDLGLQRAR